MGNGRGFEPLRVAPNRYLPDEFLDRALRFIDENQDRPFFLFFPSQLPHAELAAPPEGLAPYVVNGRSIFNERPFAGNSTYPEPVAQPYATLAAMISRLDRDVGRLVERVDQLGLGEETLIIFTSDNGPHAAGGIDDWRQLNGAGPFNGRKFDLFEGGIRVPMIARWTGQIQGGRESDQVHALWDIAPTLRSLAGAPPRGSDGLSMVDLFLNRPQPPAHSQLYWETYNWGAQSLRTTSGSLKQVAALRVGDRKLLRVEEEFTGSYLLAFNVSAGGGNESIDASIARDLSSCGWLPGLTETLNAAHRDVEGGTLPPLEPLCQLIGGDGPDFLEGSGARERIVGRSGDDELRGGEGADHILGGPGSDDINGNQGTDYINGNSGDDLLHGGMDDDTVHGGKDNDQVYGDLGNDTLYGDRGNDTLYGGEGDDTFVYGLDHGQMTIQPAGGGRDRLRCENTRAVSEGFEGNDLVFRMEGGGLIRIVDQRVNAHVAEIEGCR